MYKVFHSNVKPPVLLETWEQVRMYIRMQDAVRPGDKVRWSYTGA